MAHLREHTAVQYDLNHKDRVKALKQEPRGTCSTHIYFTQILKKFAMLSFKLQEKIKDSCRKL